MRKKLGSLVVVSVLVFVVVVIAGGGSSSTQGSTTRPTVVVRPAPAKPTVHETTTRIFSGLTPGENLAEWKDDFPGRTVVRFEVGLDGNGVPVELRIWYTK